MSLPARWMVCLLIACLLLTASPARGVIVRTRPLGDFINESQFIFTAKVETLDAEHPSAEFSLVEELKGKSSFRRMSLTLTGDADAKKLNHTPQLLKRLAPGLPLVVFAMTRDKDTIAFAYTNGTWFQLRGTADGDTIRWSFLHCEPYLHGTFKGTTAELKQLVIDVLAGKTKPPAPDPKDKGGLGPEVSEAREKDPVTLSPCHLVTLSPLPAAVIPTVLIGGPLAILAMFFPVVFGGLLLVLRRWTALLTVASINSTLYVLYDWRLLGTWFGSAVVLWLVMAVVTLAGLFWAWRRHLTAVQLTDYISSRKSDNSGLAGGLAPSLADRPRRGEGIVLAVVGILLTGALLYWSFRGGSLRVMPWKGLVVLTAGTWLGALYTLLTRLRRPNCAALPTEGVVLGAMVVAALALGSGLSWSVPGEQLQMGDLTAREGSLTGKVQRTEGGWVFTARGKGSISSSPLIAGDRIYVGAAFTSVFQGDYGVVYCLDRATGSRVWAFNEDNGRKMKPVFSSPCLADGRLFIGEGFHQDSGCRFYCLDAATGEPIWTFPTLSHTESSPWVAGGKVFFGAGDDGLYCLDATTGKECWHYQHTMHIDASPVVVNGRLYCGGGVVGAAAHHNSGIFCLDAATGREVWFHDTDLPVLTAPAVAGDVVFFALGNGKFSVSDDNRPAGALLAAAAASGKESWRFEVPDAVLTRPAVDDASIYIGSRDGHCYCVNRENGRLRWKRSLGSPILASPALVRCSGCGASAGLYVLGSDGLACCLDPATGAVLWQEDLVKREAREVQLFSSPAVVITRTTEGDRRRVIFGAGLETTAAVYCMEDALKDPE